MDGLNECFLAYFSTINSGKNLICLLSLYWRLFVRDPLQNCSLLEEEKDMPVLTL
jgi:hypothetical protein